MEETSHRQLVPRSHSFRSAPPGGLIRKVEGLASRCSALGGVAADLSFQLDQALHLLERRDNPSRPYTVVLLGGTGVGKSRLFSRLVGVQGASPSSDAERNHTRVPFAACALVQRALVGLPEEIGVQWINWDRESLVLFDTPDIDGMVLANRQVTRQVLAIADLVVFVASPDKLANAVPFEALREWSPRTRWMFVLNKSDLVSNPVANATDWASRLDSIGFTRPEIILTNADGAEDPGVARLAAKLFESRGPARLHLLRHEAFLRVACRALQQENLAVVQATRQALRARAGELAGELHQALVDGLREVEAADAFRGILREATWQRLPAHCGPLLYWPVWVRCRFLSLLTGYQMSRMAMAGPTLLGVGILGMGAATSLFRSLGPLRRVVDSLGDVYRTRLNQIKHDVRTTLEDYGLAPSVEKSADTGALPPDAPLWLTWISDKLKGFALRGADESVLDSLDADIQRASLHLSRRVWLSPAGVSAWLLGNLLPGAMLGWIVYRAGMGWFQEKYPDWSFLIIAILLLLVSVVPGFTLLAMSVWGRTSGIQVVGLVHSTREPLVVEPLARAGADLDQLESEVIRLREEMGRTLSEMDAESPDSLGMRIR